MRDVIVLDTPNEPYLRNQIFDPAVAARYPGASAMVRFYELATRAGFQVMTADVAIEQHLDGARMIVISEQSSSLTDRLYEGGAALSAVVCFETPSVAWRFYRDLLRISARYAHAFLFSGARARVSSRTEFHAILFPQPQGDVAEVGHVSWDAREFMTLINSNKGRAFLRPSHLIAALRDPDLRREIYSERRKAIRFFHAHTGFHLYGRGWDRKLLGASQADHQAAQRCYRGACEDKVTTLARYRFAICFENATFGGYVTEKIFDCFYAGCVPVYYGAPDIVAYIPKGCFVDFRDFPDYPALQTFLLEMVPREFEAYRTAAREFLHSAAFRPFSQDYFAQSLLSAARQSAGPA